MKILASSLILCLSLFAKVANADSSFLPALEFSYLYKDNPLFEETYSQGISKDSYVDFLLSEERTLGEKVAMIDALSSYFERLPYDDDESNDSEDYFFEYATDFERQALAKYMAKSMEDDRIPTELLLLHTLMMDFGTYQPSVAKYNEIARRMPSSLTVQSIKVIAFAYDVLYNERKQLQDTYKNDYLKPYMASWKSYTEDVRPEAYDLVVDWESYVTGYFQ